MAKPIEASQDGKSHINIYSKGRTVLGRTLSNFSHHKFNHDELGSFSGMEGLYYYLKTGKKNDSFRRLSGFAAKKLGQTLPRVEMDKEEFYRLLKLGCRCLYRDNPKIHELILDQVVENKSEVLPFEHYYLNGNHPIFPKGNEWLTEEWEEIRKDAISMAGGTLSIINDRTYVTGMVVTE